eukprot:1142811-Pelagomonas_calceolata.AAC.2
MQGAEVMPPRSLKWSSLAMQAKSRTNPSVPTVRDHFDAESKHSSKRVVNPEGLLQGCKRVSCGSIITPVVLLCSPTLGKRHFHIPKPLVTAA